MWGIMWMVPLGRTMLFARATGHSFDNIRNDLVKDHFLFRITNCLHFNKVIEGNGLDLFLNGGDGILKCTCFHRISLIGRKQIV